jgi:hypothetical protein
MIHTGSSAPECSDRYFTMFKHHTDEGLSVTKAPGDVVREQMSVFWHNNKHIIKEERWPAGATEIDYWESPSYVVKVGEQKGLRGLALLHGSIKLLAGLGGTQPSDDPFLVIQLKYKSPGKGFRLSTVVVEGNHQLPVCREQDQWEWTIQPPPNARYLIQ